MRQYLKSLLPRGLFGRAALILVVPVVTIQLIVSVVFIQRHFERVTQQMTTSIQIEISHLVSVVKSAPDLATARARAEEIGAALELEVILPSDDAPDADRREFIDWSGREVILTLRSRMPELIAVDLVSGNAQVWAWFQTQHGVMRVAVGRGRMSASNPHQLLVLMVFTSILMTGVAYIFLRNQLTPIARMAQAAEAFGKGEVMPFRPRGATEVRAAGQAFLDMRLRIERQIEARTQMLSGVSHDLRTPLTRLKLGLSFLPEEEEVEALKRDVQQMERMVDEFLAFARGDAMEAAEEVDPTALLVLVVADAVRAGQAVRLGAMDWPGGTMRLRPQAGGRQPVDQRPAGALGCGRRRPRHPRGCARGRDGAVPAAGCGAGSEPRRRQWSGSGDCRRHRTQPRRGLAAGSKRGVGRPARRVDAGAITRWTATSGASRRGGVLRSG
jgi:two-component system osmolarity sensor histidine kinase EnvZ